MQKALLALTLTFISLATFGQTTVEEYNYVTKGYKVQIESGLDMKKNYAFTDIQKFTVGERTVDMKRLDRVKGTKNEIAAYLIVYSRKGMPSEYICIPQPLSTREIYQSYFDQLYNGRGDHSERLQLILVVVSSQLKWQQL